MIKNRIFNQFLKTARVEPRRTPVERGAMKTWAVVDKVRKNFLADVKLLSGEVIEKVPYPAGFVSIAQQGKGRVSNIQKGARVLLDFVGGSSASPVIINVYPIGALKEADNLDTHPDPEMVSGESNTIIDYHPSGYKVKYEDGKISITMAGAPILEVSTTSAGLKVGTGTISVPNGDSLQTFLNQLLASIQALYTAIENVSTAPMDGGASYKAGLTTAVTSNPLPSVPANLNNTNTKVSS